MKKRPYEIEVELQPAGYYIWSIEVGGVVIAKSGRKTDMSPIEAVWSAHEWARTHVLLGYELRFEWWNPKIIAADAFSA